jgi:BirA family biotin operon repressor/biotin-[acetyl-CoA-carboxylase] ligase
LAQCWADEGTVVIAEEQTAGRGRMGRTWQGDPHQNLTFSLVLRPKSEPSSINLLPLYVGVAVAEAIELETGLEVVCKWPNDILVNGKKAAGILIEGSLKETSIDFVVVGIGVNVNQKTFPPEIAPKATSLGNESGREISRESLFRQILLSLERHYQSMKTNGVEHVISLWSSRSSMIGRQVSVDQNGSIFTGVVKGLDGHGALLLDRDGMDVALLAGDVTILDSGGMYR